MHPWQVLANVTFAIGCSDFVDTSEHSRDSEYGKSLSPHLGSEDDEEDDQLFLDARATAPTTVPTTAPTTAPTWVRVRVIPYKLLYVFILFVIMIVDFFYILQESCKTRHAFFVYY